MGSLMHESDARRAGFHVVDYEDIFFVEVFPTILCQDGMAAGHPPEDCDIAIDNKLADRDVVERRIGNVVPGLWKAILLAAQVRRQSAIRRRASSMTNDFRLRRKAISQRLT